MRNSLIIEYEAKDEFEFITRIFDTTKEMAEALNTTVGACKTIMYRAKAFKKARNGFIYERIWLNREY